MNVNLEKFGSGVVVVALFLVYSAKFKAYFL